MSSNKNTRYNRFSSGTTSITASENTNGVRLSGGAASCVILSSETVKLPVENKGVFLPLKNPSVHK